MGSVSSMARVRYSVTLTPSDSEDEVREQRDEQPPGKEVREHLDNCRSRHHLKQAVDEDREKEAAQDREGLPQDPRQATWCTDSPSSWQNGHGTLSQSGACSTSSSSREPAAQVPTGSRL